MVKHNNGHRKAIEKIANHADKFGFAYPIYVAIEATLYHSGRVLAQPDVIIEVKSGIVHIIEYKAMGNGELLDRARKQLENAKWWYASHRPEIPPEKIYTHIISRDDPKYKDLLRGR